MVGLLDEALLDLYVVRRRAEAVLGVVKGFARRDEGIEVHRDQVAKSHFEALLFKELHRRHAEVVSDGLVTRIV